MSFKEIQNIQLSYNTLSDQIVLDFYIPCLEKAIIYKRAVGFFSSNILLQISKGLGAFADNRGHMQLLVSTKLEEADYEAIKKGYDLKEYVTDKIIQNFDFNIDFDQRDVRFEMLSYMISSGLLDIKIVALEQNNDVAMFHRKVGIFEDNDGNIIAFSGSGNETYNGYNQNDEDFEVYCSWKSDESEMRCYSKQMEFEKIWGGTAKGLITIPFPEVIKEKILSFKRNDNKSFSIIDENFKEKISSLSSKIKEPCANDNINFFDYQKKAIDNWVNNGYKGIFDMATGTGKTFTGAGAICRLYNDKKRLIVFICCPFTHLVDQWYEELKLNFNIDAIKCFGSEDYLLKLQREARKFKRNKSNFLCAIITNSSFKKEIIQDIVLQNLEYTMILVDEAHNFGAEEIRKTMYIDYPYRLALSATLERHNDKTGTDKLFNFFGQKCIEYTLEQAICDGKLTPYKYYPVIVSLTENEYEKYIMISKQISKCVKKDEELSDYAKKLLIKRARIIAGAQNKIEALKDQIINYKNEYNMLVYCGAVKYGDDNFSDDEDKRQIDIVLSMLNKELSIYSSKFTSDENNDERKNILKAFKEQDIQALVAIKCLDEGLNIPAIKTAFILASSTNPKEYIQRRGRVLRKFPGKEYAEIYDFITLPIPLSKVSLCSDNLAIEKNLVRKEFNRIIDFANLSLNPSESNEVINKIKEVYNMNVILNEEEDYE